MPKGGEMREMDFETAHEAWLKDHIERRTGERRGRLLAKRYAETLFLQKVWWPLMGDFEGLHPEYEVLDWRGRPYNADFVWLPDSVKLVFEMKGYGPHVESMDRKGYCEELNRETFMKGMGFRVVSVPHDDVASRPEVTQSLIRMVIGRFQGKGAPVTKASLMEKEILLLGFRLGRPLRRVDVARHLDVSERTAARYLCNLCGGGYLGALRTGAGKERITEYRLLKANVRDVVW